MSKTTAQTYFLHRGSRAWFTGEMQSVVILGMVVWMSNSFGLLSSRQPAIVSMAEVSPTVIPRFPRSEQNVDDTELSSSGVINETVHQYDADLVDDPTHTSATKTLANHLVDGKQANQSVNS